MLRILPIISILYILLLTSCAGLNQIVPTSTVEPIPVLIATKRPTELASLSSPSPIPTASPTSTPIQTATSLPPTPTSTPSPAPTKTAPLTATPTIHPIQHVIHVSIDGLIGVGLADLIQHSDYAVFQRLVAEGATTFNARTDYDWTVTLPNHIAMLTGRPSIQHPTLPITAHHGYESNGIPFEGETIHNSGNPHVDYIPSVFDVVHDHGLKTALYATKLKFGLFDVSYNEVNGAADTIGEDNGRDKIDIYDNNWTAMSISDPMHKRMLVSLATERPHYAFIHYSEPDAFGHGHGWDSEQYRFAVRAVNNNLGELLDVIESDDMMAGKTAVIITSDHGGKGTDGHSAAWVRENYTIPVIVWGVGVANGADLYTLNEGERLDPGGERPDYAEPLQPIRNGDTGVLALDLLNLPPLPCSCCGRCFPIHVNQP